VTRTSRPGPAPREGDSGDGVAPGPDVRAAVVTGVTTVLWYAVPDVVGPRWARALAKLAVLGGGLGVGLATTAEGRAVRAGLSAVAAPAKEADDANGSGDVDDAEDENGAVDDADAGGDVGALEVDPLLAGATVAVGLGATVALAVAGEKWAYRLGERWRARGRPWPHTRVGLVAGVLAAGLTLLEPPREDGA
jgi:hypothetical protein